MIHGWQHESVVAHPGGLSKGDKVKKRTPVTVALLFLIATLTGYVQVAASTPAQTLTAPATPAPLPAIAEQTGLVIGPGQVGRLSLPLNVGDRVEGKVTVVPEDVYFVIEDRTARWC
jgi:hypothetical protein